MSSIRLGDKVRFVNENLEGIVTTLSGHTAGVTIEDDFEIPVPVSQIVKISDKEPQKEEKEAIAHKPATGHQGVYIAFDRITDTLLGLMLHNSMSDELMYVFYEQDKHAVHLKRSGTLSMNGTIEIGRYDLEKFSQWPVLIIQALYANKKNDIVPPPVSNKLHFQAKEFHGAFRHAFFLNRQAYLFNIDEPMLPEIDFKKLQEKDFNEKPESSTSFEKPAGIVDLHIEKLGGPVTDPAMMITKQMEVFVRSLELAHVHKMKSIIFIHGIGNHFLKNKIRNYLKQQKVVVASYHDADMLRFGGGATEVILN